MIELSDSVREKLDNPEIIKGMAESLLINFGKPTFYYDYDRSLDFFGFDYYLTILPEGDLCLRGGLDLSRRADFDNLFFTEKLEKSSFDFILSQNQKLISSFFNECSKISTLDNVLVYWGEENEDTRHDSRVFYSTKNSSLVSSQFFKKGDWQDYLAKCYLASIKLNRDEKNILE